MSNNSSSHVYRLSSDDEIPYKPIDEEAEQNGYVFRLSDDDDWEPEIKRKEGDSNGNRNCSSSQISKTALSDVKEEEKMNTSNCQSKQQKSITLPPSKLGTPVERPFRKDSELNEDRCQHAHHPDIKNPPNKITEEELEELFKDRFTENDQLFVQVCKREPPLSSEPPIIPNWQRVSSNWKSHQTHIPASSNPMGYKRKFNTTQNSREQHENYRYPT